MTDEIPDLLALREGLPEGPWSISENDPVIVIAPGGICIADCRDPATARAIAAIPSMLEEIERLRAKDQTICEEPDHCELCDGLEKHADALQEHNDRLRARVQALESGANQTLVDELVGTRALNTEMLALIKRAADVRQSLPDDFYREARAILTKTETA